MSNHPKTYKAAVIKQKGGRFELVDKEWQDPKDGHIVIKTLACGVCASDHIVVDQAMPTGLPRVPGHEIVGEVVAVPESEKRFKVGDRVGSGWHGGHCNVCRSCTRGDFVTCDNENINGILTDGGYAEYVTLRAEAVCDISKEIDPAEAAPLLCAGVTTFNSLRNMNLHPGDVVAVQGIGGLGHLAIQFARQSGYKVIALSQSDSKKDLAQELGAHEFLYGDDAAEQLAKKGGAKVILAVAPSGKAISSLIPALSVGGQLVVLALSDDLTVPVMPMIQKRLSIRGWPSGSAADSYDTVEFARVHGVHCKVEKFPLAQAQQAYDKMMSNKARFRAVLTF